MESPQSDWAHPRASSLTCDRFPGLPHCPARPEHFATNPAAPEAVHDGRIQCCRAAARLVDASVSLCFMDLVTGEHGVILVAVFLALRAAGAVSAFVNSFDRVGQES